VTSEFALTIKAIFDFHFDFDSSFSFPVNRPGTASAVPAVPVVPAEPHFLNKKLQNV
jgi:hypothetical protein